MVFEDGLMYLGYRLKASNYTIVDWMWLVAKIESIINRWNRCWLSRVGRLVLIKYVLEDIPL